MALTSHVAEPAFVRRRNPTWTDLEILVNLANQKGVRALDEDRLAKLAPLYRDVCSDLAAAQAARYSAPLVDYLQALTASAHTVVYSRAPRSTELPFGLRPASLRSAFFAFPRAVRHRWRAMLLAFVLFFAPFAVGVVWALADPTFTYRIVPEPMLKELTKAYKEGFQAGRGEGQDAGMAGFYVYNNVGIALRCFATGIFAGVGSAVYLVMDGLFTGAILGYVASQGAGYNIFTFVVGHSALELGAIVLAGGAGMSMGWSMVSPGPYPRIQALQLAAKEIVVIVAGAAVMLLMAAAIEGFWSSSSIPDEIKQAFGAGVLLLLGAYLTLAGRAPDAVPTEHP
jgi:uncharacterized membrane protein SpoIIM required for sporulation